MTSAIKISTIKREAETYLSQGLYREALSVYKNFLANTSELDPTLRKIVDESIGHIRSVALNHNCEKDVSMSTAMAPLPNRATKQNATANDRIVTAQTLIDVGCYERALEEYRRLLKNNYLTSAVMRGVAMCLVHIVQPKHIANAVDRFAAEFFKHPQNRKAFKLSISKKISKDQYPQHFSALTHHLVILNGGSM